MDVDFSSDEEFGLEFSEQCVVNQKPPHTPNVVLDNNRSDSDEEFGLSPSAKRPTLNNQRAQNTVELLDIDNNSSDSDEEFGLSPSAKRPTLNNQRAQNTVDLLDFDNNSSDSEEEFGLSPSAKRPTLNDQRSTCHQPCHQLDFCCSRSDSDRGDSSDEEEFGSRAYWSEAKRIAPPHQRSHTLSGLSLTSASTETESFGELRERISPAFTQESSSVRTKPTVHVGKTIRKRKEKSSTVASAVIPKSQKVLELTSCALPLGFTCKCSEQCAGKFTTTAIQNFRKGFWEQPAKVCSC
jgi:hypothetical protein